MKRPINSALSVARDVIYQVGSGRKVPTIEDLMVAVRSFENVRFDVPSGVESDGFIFEYGEVGWFSDPTFVVGFVRQLEMVDIKGEHEGYLQVQFEFRYRIDSELKSLQSYHSWWFREDGTSFDEWLKLVKRNPVWEVIRAKIPVAFDVSQDLV